MPLNLMKSRMLPIGIDLGTSTVKLIQLRSEKGNLELTGADAFDVPADRCGDMKKRLDYLSDTLREVCKDQFDGRKCVIALPASATVVQHVKIAKLARAEIEKALRWELEGKLPFPTADAVIRHMVAGETHTDGQAGLEVIVVAAARKTVEAHLEMAGRAKLEVVGLDVEPCAILECFARLFRRAEDQSRTTLFLDLGHANTQIVIAHGSKPVFTRNLEVGARQIDQTVGAQLGISPDQVRTLRRLLNSGGDQTPEQAVEADRMYERVVSAIEPMAAEVNKCLRYFESVFPATPVERAIFLGGQAMDRRLCQKLAQQLNLPAQIGDPLARIKRADGVGVKLGLDRRDAQPAWAVAVGLSLGAEMANAA